MINLQKIQYLFLNHWFNFHFTWMFFSLNSFFRCYFRSKVWKNVSHIRAGCEEPIIFVKFLKCCYFHYLWPHMSHSLPHLWWGPWLLKIVFGDVLYCHFFFFVHRPVWKLFLIFSESAWQGNSNHANFGFEHQPQAEKLLFKVAKMVEDVSAGFWSLLANRFCVSKWRFLGSE